MSLRGFYRKEATQAETFKKNVKRVNIMKGTKGFGLRGGRGGMEEDLHGSRLRRAGRGQPK